MSFFVASYYKIGSFSSENSFLMKNNSLEDKMINKQTQQCIFGDEIQKRFTAYVKEAMRNTRSTYYRKKMIKEIFSLNIDFIDNMMLRSALKKLSGKDILIIQLRVLNDYSYFEIGKLLNMKESAVRTRYFRAIQSIRKLMED